MRAVTVAPGGGGPEALTFGAAPDPSPGPGEALVRVVAAGVNFLDVYRRRAGAVGVPGMEGAGVVERLDDAGRRAGLAVGDRVAWVMHPGAYAELACVPVERIVPVPEGIELELAAAAIFQGLTAQYLMEESHRVRSGETLLVHAGAGGVGRLLTQMCAAAGACVLATVSSDEKARIAVAAGAGEAIRYDRVDFAEAARALTGGRGVDAVFDAVNRATFDGSVRALRPRGTLVLYGEASGQVDPIRPKALQAAGSIKLTYPSLAHFVDERAELLARAARLFALVLDGTVAVATTTYRLAEAAHAHRELEARRTSGKLVLAVR